MTALRSWIQINWRRHVGGPITSTQRISSDGSTRRFLRITGPDGSLICLVYPKGSPSGSSENDSLVHIGRHLYSMSIPVPKIYAYEREKGWILMEDMGDDCLQKMVFDAKAPLQVMDLYRQVMEVLLNFQFNGPRGFEMQWTVDGQAYDRDLMLRRESGYFLEAFLGDLLGWDGNTQVLLQEFENLACVADDAPKDCLIHRDFQSRNILFVRGRGPAIIDFQGSRVGPLQYDVAALVLDPYVPLGDGQRDELLGLYLALLEDRHGVSPEEFLRFYPPIALHRLLQILGAFSFLSKRRKKGFFLQWIPRALDILWGHLQRHPDLLCPRLREVVHWACERIKANQGAHTLAGSH